ncbi:hypothetical protein ACEPAH_6383 [Sanghuangporus vaninii]
MSHSGPAITSTGTSTKRKAHTGHGTGSSTGKATLKTGVLTRPPVLRNRDANRQTRLTAVMRPTVPVLSKTNHNRAGPGGSGSAVASSSRNQANIQPQGHSPSVIVLTSDDEDDDILCHPGLPKPADVNAGMKRKERENERGTVNANEGKGKEKESEASRVASLKAENEELKQKYEKRSKELKEERDTIIKLKHSRALDRMRLRELEAQALEKRRPAPAPPPPPPDLTEIDDLISCEICTTMMWHPATIRECGHTFCESCLHDWFNSTYTRHAAAHPEFITGPLIPPDYYANRHVPQIAHAIKMMLAEWKVQVPQPKYTCPTCRSEAKSRPFEVYFVKEAVSKMAKLVKSKENGDNEGRPAPARMNRAGGGITSARRPPVRASIILRPQFCTSISRANSARPLSLPRQQFQVRQMSSSPSWLARSESEPYTHIIPSSPAPGVALITLNRPKALNALCAALISELNDALNRVENDESVGAVVITGSERAFAAGADIKEMKDKEFHDVNREDFLANWHRLANLRKPAIAAVSGYALGGGCELAMMCDILLASPTAVFGQPEIDLGVIPGAGGTQRLTRLIGQSRAMELVLTGRKIPASEAEQWGLVTRVVGGNENVVDEAVKIAANIAGKSQVAVRTAKECVRKAAETSLAEGLVFERRAFHALFATKDQKEGMSAFVEKRKPKFANL